ncbi:MAG: DUF1592 domain-containing protein [Myxococcales bacterium]|nr:DUF1592 domain-containing protein [Myxococcales bacterium]
MRGLAIVGAALCLTIVVSGGTGCAASGRGGGDGGPDDGSSADSAGEVDGPGSGGTEAGVGPDSDDAQAPNLCPATGVGAAIFRASCVGGAPLADWSPVRRISRAEYDNMVRDLLGDRTRPAAQFVAESPLTDGVNFWTNTCHDIGATDTLPVQQYLQAAESLAQTAVSDPNILGALLMQYGGAACATRNDACAQAFIGGFALRAFRGFYDSDEGSSLFQNVFSPVEAMLGDFVAGVQAVITSVLTSPRFLYVVELGRPGASGRVVPLGPYELAARLALFLWRSVPDAALLAAAASDSLQTADQIRAQAVRMLGARDGQGHLLAQGALDDFAQQWMQLENASALTRDSQYATWNANPGLSSELLNETLATFHATVLAEDGGAGGTLPELLTSTQSYQNADVRAFYAGQSLPAAENCTDPSLEGNCYTKSAAAGAANPRAGILTQAIVVAAQSHPSYPSPTLRGRLVREQVLCDAIPPPPPTANTTPPATVPPNQSIKDQYSAHRLPGCNVCHDKMDLIGDAFGNYDATGAYQRKELDGHADDGTQPIIDPSGSVVVGGPGELATTFTSAIDLAMQLAGATQVQQCFALQEFRYALGRIETPADACSLQQVFQAFSGSGLNLQQLLLAIVQSDAFRNRTAEDPAGGCR